MKLRKVQLTGNFKLTRDALSIPASQIESGVVLLLKAEGANNQDNNTFIDSSANNYAVTRYGNVSQGAFTPFSRQLNTTDTEYVPSLDGGSAYFGGGSDALTVPSGAGVSGNGEFTFETWVYTSTFGSGYRVLYTGGSSGSVALVLNSNMTLSIGRVLVAFDATTTNTLTADAWNHVAVSRSGGTLRMFVNGVQGYSGSQSHNYSTGTSTIGIDYNLASSPFVGYLSGLKIETAGLYTANFSLPAAPASASSNTKLLLSFTNSGVVDSACIHDVQTAGGAKISTSVVRPGQNSSIRINGSGSYLSTDTPHVFTLDGDFTFETWFNLENISSYQMLVSPKFNGDMMIAVSYPADGISVGRHNVDWQVSFTGMTAQSNTWNHLAITRQNGFMRCFINGTQIGTTQLIATPFTVNQFRIGNVPGIATTVPLTGYIDDCRLTLGLARYTGAFTPPTSL